MKIEADISKGMIKKRKTIISFLISFLMPGLGQVYNGQLIKGISLNLISQILLFILFVTELQFNFYRLIICLCIVLTILIYIVVDAVYFSTTTKEYRLKPYNKWYIYLIIFIVGVCLSLINDEIKSIKAYKISASSMRPTLEIGDRIMVDKKYYSNNQPQRGEIIVFEYHEKPEKEFVKRIMAIPGDKIEILNKQLFINDKLQNENYVIYSDTYIPENDPRITFAATKVPSDSVFVLGDDRDNSFDSRFMGFIDFKYLRGKALYIYWAKEKDRIGKELK